MVLPLQAQAAVDPQRWTLTDSSGHYWGLTLFEQPDPAYPAGWRLRLTARSPGQVVDHQRPLLLSDGLGGAWNLPNRSEEMVRQGEEVIPEASAQFDAHDLDPRPSEVLPLQLEVPTDNQEGALHHCGSYLRKFVASMDGTGCRPGEPAAISGSRQSL